MTSPIGLRLDAAGQHTLDHVLAIVRVWTPADGVIYVNRAWRDLTGTTLEQNLGEGWLHAVDTGDRAALVAALRGHPSGGTSDYRLQAFDGRTVPVHDAANALFDDTSRELIGLIHTVTVRDPASTVDAPPTMSKWAHELRGPLNAILGWSDLLAAGENDPAIVQRGLQAIASNARQQARIIKRMTE
jgi:signal transduction histidine kinase